MGTADPDTVSVFVCRPGTCPGVATRSQTGVAPEPVPPDVVAAVTLKVIGSPVVATSSSLWICAGGRVAQLVPVMKRNVKVSGVVPLAIVKLEVVGPGNTNRLAGGLVIENATETVSEPMSGEVVR